MLGGQSQWLELRDRAEKRQRLLILKLAYELYLRDHGEYPKRADDLLDGYLDALPIDPFGSGEPIEYDPLTADD